MKFDVIISNPPYGKIGNEITKCIIDNIDFDCFVNLLPANDYRRFHKENALYQYVDIRSMRSVINGFNDAAVTTMMCKINKERAYYISEDEFEIENYIDDSLRKYFYESRKRSNFAFDNPDCGKRPDTWIERKTFVIGFRDMSHSHLPYSKNVTSYKWNVEHSIDWKYFVDNHNNPRATRAGTYEVSYYGVTFNSEKECKNFTDFVYSSDGFRFMSKVFTALNVDSFIQLNKFMPKVNWEKPQTVESILKDYGYTEDEIKEVINDLVNFKDMER